MAPDLVSRADALPLLRRPGAFAFQRRARPLSQPLAVGEGAGCLDHDVAGDQLNAKRAVVGDPAVSNGPEAAAIADVSILDLDRYGVGQRTRACVGNDLDGPLTVEGSLGLSRDGIRAGYAGTFGLEYMPSLPDEQSLRETWNYLSPAFAPEKSRAAATAVRAGRNRRVNAIRNVPSDDCASRGIRTGLPTGNHPSHRNDECIRLGWVT